MQSTTTPTWNFSGNFNMMYHVILVLAFVVLQIAGQTNDVNNVKKSSEENFKGEWFRCTTAGRKDTLSLWQECDDGNWRFQVALFCKANGERKVGLRAIIVNRESMGSHILATYEVDSVDTTMNDKQLRESVCNSIAYELNTDYRILTIRYYHEKEKWCDIFDIDDDHLKESDKCDVMAEKKRQLTKKRLAMIKSVTHTKRWIGEWYRCTKDGERLTGPTVEYTGWHPCEPSSYTIEATFLCTDNKERRVGIRGNIDLVVYSHYKVNFGDDVMDEELLKAACEGVKYEISKEYSTFTFRFYNDKVWWCNVYSKDGRFLKLDKCDSIAEETSWLKDKIPYKSVTLADDFEDECTVGEDFHELCSKNGATFKTKSLCSYDPQMNPPALKIKMSYQGIDVQDFAVTSGIKSQNLEDGMENLCRLFNVREVEKGSKIKVQYFHTESELRCGVWRCMEFNKKENGFEAFNYSKTGGIVKFQQCLKLTEYGLPSFYYETMKP